MTLYIDIHALQSVPPSNINRDDTGAPKSAIFGGVKRHRVSSQSWKKAIRDHYSAHHGVSSIRTMNIVEATIRRAQDSFPWMLEGDMDALHSSIFDAYVISGLAKKDKKGGVKDKDGNYKSDLEALVLVSYAQMDAVLLAIQEGFVEDKKRMTSAIMTNNSLDLALFGRMVANSTDLNVEAASQFAHAISTHAIESEYDYFTAVDELKTSQTDAGAAMIGDVEFTSSTLYRYASVNLDALKANFENHDALPDALADFLDSFVKSIPSGKQNTFAALTLPSGVIIALRESPLSFAGAFEKPVKPGHEGGIMDASKDALTAFARETYHNFDATPQQEIWLGFDRPENTLGVLKDTIREWVR